MIAAFNRISAGIAVALALSLAGSHAASAQDTTLQITVQGGRFQPAELHGPVNKPIVLLIKNNDAKPIEFESTSLRIEKVVAAKAQASIRIRPLAPGRYEFFDDFNTGNRGVLIVE